MREFVEGLVAEANARAAARASEVWVDVCEFERVTYFVPGAEAPYVRAVVPVDWRIIRRAALAGTPSEPPRAPEGFGPWHPVGRSLRVAGGSARAAPSAGLPEPPLCPVDWRGAWTRGWRAKRRRA